MSDTIQWPPCLTTERLGTLAEYGLTSPEQLSGLMALPTTRQMLAELLDASVVDMDALHAWLVGTGNNPADVPPPGATQSPMSKPEPT